MTELIITEKPSSARKIAAALADKSPVQKKYKQGSYFQITHNGKEILVASAVGHLYGLVEKDKKGWNYPVFSIEWQASHKSNKDLKYVKNYIDIIENLSKEVDEFTVACDYDVEGEVIGLNVVRFACKQKDANRMKFSTLTKADLVKSYETKDKKIDWGQALAGETRHKLDWFYGINLSRALTSAVKAAGSFKIMSSGRVQGPALKMLVDREREIMNFKPEPFWVITLDGKIKSNAIEGDHIKGKIFEKDVAEKIMKVVEGCKEATVTEIKRIQRQQKQPTPFNLTDLQSESYSQFKITPKETLSLAQKLYLAGVTSYPRTSSQQLDPKLGFKKILTDLGKQPQYGTLTKELLKKKKLVPNNGKKTDPAHPAIYPTGSIPEGLDPREGKIYDLIVKRFMATFGEPALRETMTVTLDAKSELFKTKGTRTITENWHKFYKPYLKVEEITLPDMEEGETIKVEKITKHDKETQPPKRFNQSSIIKELEKRNLGTKATRADILDRLFKRGYVEGVQITVSKFGIETIEILEKYADRIIDEKLTADFEEDMEKIREGKEKQEQVLDKAKKFLTKLLGDFKNKEVEIGEELLKSVKESRDIANYMGNCPDCEHKGKLMVKLGKFGRFVACSKYPDCKRTFKVPKTGLLKYNGDVCEVCKHPIIEAGSGRKKIKRCLNENCSSRLEDGVEVLKPGEEAGPKYKEEGITCPTCNVGKMVLRKSFYGEFLGCNNYPKCQTMMRIIAGKVEVDKPIVKKPGSKKKKTAKKKTAKKKAVKKKAAAKGKK